MLFKGLDDREKIISIHAPREGSDIHQFDRRVYHFIFQSTLPARGATMTDEDDQRFLENFNPRSPRGERLLPRGGLPPRRCISIHAPREGSDFSRLYSRLNKRNFNPRSPRGERLQPAIQPAKQKEFQSTLPARGATVHVVWDILTQHNFNPRSPRGERRAVCCLVARYDVFQSTLPARGATIWLAFHSVTAVYFNPRSPRGERRLRVVS